MKAYIATTGVVFALIAGAHFVRVAVEGSRLATEPVFVALTLATMGLSLWAARLLWRGRRSGT